MKYLSNDSLLDNLRGSQNVSHKRWIFGRRQQLSAADAAERSRWYSNNKRAQHQQSGRIINLMGWKKKGKAHRPESHEASFAPKSQCFICNFQQRCNRRVRGHLHHSRQQQHADDGVGLAEVPARDVAHGAEDGQQVFRFHRCKLPSWQASALISQRGDCGGVDVIAKVACQSCRDLHGER